jgi:hypothetical protein
MDSPRLSVCLSWPGKIPTKRDDMLTVLRLVRSARGYPGGLGFEEELSIRT